MDAVTFSPAIDWSHELFNSTTWVVNTFAVTAPCLLVALVVIARTTQWGRQFWHVTGDYTHFRRQFFRQPIDNPDQRIQQDIDIFTTVWVARRTTRRMAPAKRCSSAPFSPF